MRDAKTKMKFVCKTCTYIESEQFLITLSCNNGLSTKPNKLTNKMVKNKETTKRGYCELYC